MTPAAAAADVVVVGAGLLGLATARDLLLRAPGSRIVVVEKEDGPARHQSGRSSGVVHSGIYYAPGSRKARLCVEGRRLLVAFCDEHGVRHERCGKVIVAVAEAELPRLDELERRGRLNGVEGLERIDASALRAVEPAAVGLSALWAPGAGIVDYVGVCVALERDIVRRGGDVRYAARVEGMRPGRGGVRVLTARGPIDAGFVLTCGGLHADRLAQMTGAPAGPRVVPFRGRYYRLRPAARHLCRGLIYPVPDPAFPFLGVHLTRRVDGEVWAGPNAVLALAREGYTATAFDRRDVLDALRSPGFRRLARRAWRTGLAEIRNDLSRRRFVEACRRLVPALRPQDVEAGPTGVRAQVIREDGTLLDDFHVDVGERSLHVRNAPSPAATSCLALGREIADAAAAAGALR